MIKTTYLIMTLACFLGCATTDKWTKAEKTKEVAWLILHAVDYSQTRYAMDRPDEFKEANPLLGDHPSEGRLNLFALITGIGHVWLTDYVGKEYRSLFQNITLGFKTGTVVNNFYVGAKIEF